MTWANLDLVVEQNAQFQQKYLFFDTDAAGLYAQFGNPSDLVPHDFTSCTLKMEVRQNEQTTSTLIDTYGTASGEIVFTSGTITPGPAAPAYNNGFTLTITGTRTAALSSGIYFYDLMVTSAGGINDFIFRGSFEVRPTQTR